MTGQPTVVALHLAPTTRLPVRTVTAVEAEASLGLVGATVDR